MSRHGHRDGRRLQRRRRRRDARRAGRLGVRLGPASPTASYLRIDAIVEAALATGADAIHPGYGFLAERAAFARAVTDAGLIFVGPSPEAIDSARRQAGRPTARPGRGVATVPGHPRARAGRPARRACRRSSSRPPRRSASRCSSRRRPAAGDGGCAGSSARRPARRAAAAACRGGVRVRRWDGLPRARGPAGAPHRGPAARRPRRPRSSPSGSATARSSDATRSSWRRRRRPA